MSAYSYTPEQAELLAKCKTVFTPIWEKRLVLLTEMMKVLEFSQPDLVRELPQNFLAPLSDWFQRLEILEKDTSLLGTRLGLYLGEYWSKELELEWHLEENPDSLHFAQYILIDPSREIAVNPIFAAFQFFGQPEGRNLRNWVQEETEKLLLTRVVKGDQVFELNKRK